MVSLMIGSDPTFIERRFSVFYTKVYCENMCAIPQLSRNPFTELIYFRALNFDLEFQKVFIQNRLIIQKKPPNIYSFDKRHDLVI